MQRTFLLLAVVFIVVAARADLVMEEEFGGTNVTGHVILKLHADKMRMDQSDTNGNTFSVIIDLATRDSITLMSDGRSYRTRSGTEIRRQMEAAQRANPTNAMNLPSAPAVDTGIGEKAGGFDTELYAWSGADGAGETLWVATNFPGYNSIRNELAKLDRFNDTGPHRNAQPELAALPGMVVKSESTDKGIKKTFTLLSAKMEPVDASVFELPAGYVPWKPPVNNPTNTVMTPAK